MSAPSSQPTPTPPQRSLSREAGALLASVIGIAVVGFFVGINDGVPQEDHQHASDWLAPPISDGSGGVESSTVIPAASYLAMRRSQTGPTSRWKPTLDQIPQPASDLLAEIQPNEQDKQQSTLTRAARRAFNGAPPIIPHAVENTTDAACYACHGNGLRIGDRVANRMSHAFLANCTQCHAPPPPKPFAAMDVSVASTFVGLPAPLRGERAFPGGAANDPPFDLDAGDMPCLSWKPGGMGGTGVLASVASQLPAVSRTVGNAGASDCAQPSRLSSGATGAATMSGTPESPRDEGFSRREFVQGRFWRAFRRRRSSGEEPIDQSSPRPRRRSLVMRYPKSLREVAAGDPQQDVDSAATSEPAARRRTIPLFRPPGAIDEVSFLAGCTRCNRCVEACPHEAITHAPDRLREAAGTPVIAADHQPCRMCDDFPCIAACEPNVLTRLVPAMMGTAKVTEHLCLAHHGTTCTVCSERCPVEGAIFVSKGKPTVNEAKCTGCGVCRYVCPAPENAILLMPSFLRPTPPGASIR